ncbi:MAG: hypothetical protein O2812_00580 [Chloroflexi bacterium]|nr:hypothetical protein [Chloroflexota bacterium]
MKTTIAAEHIAFIRDLMALTDAIVEQHGLDTKAAGTAGMAAFHQLQTIKELDPVAADALYMKFKGRIAPEPQLVSSVA